MKKKHELLADAKYNGKFIAIKNLRIIDVGENEFDLASKLAAELPDEVILIKKVEPKESRFDLSSPEVIG
jgi:hypothetical protein